MTFTPLKITAYPECGIICDRYLPIDSIIDRQCNREAFGHEDVTVPGEVLEPQLEAVRERMPIKRIRFTTSDQRRREYYYSASFAEWSHAIEGQDHWVKKFDSKLIDLLERRKMARLNVASGRYRGYHMPVFYRAACAVSWYVVGDGDRIMQLLSTLTHIGKKTSQGWGAVSRWEIKPWPEDWSLYRNGHVMRAIPAETGTLYGYRPSYWLPRNKTPCLLPAISPCD